MEIDEAKHQFIQSWGSLGSKWGINRTMAQIHALMLIAPDPLSTEDIMKDLNISRGNVNMNIRTLMDWRLVYKELIPGDRKEYFKGEKDIWLVTKRVMSIRRQRELEPMLQVLSELKNVTGENTKEVEEFNKSIKDITKFAGQADQVLDRIASSEEKWFWNLLIKVLK